MNGPHGQHTMPASQRLLPLPQQSCTCYLVQWVSQHACDWLAWDENSPPSYQHQSRTDTSHGNWSTAIQAGLETSVEVSTEYGEDSFMVTWGAMHTEKMLWGVSGDCLDGSGWITALNNSGISTSDKAQSFISVHHICRTGYMHQVSVATLYMLMWKVYDQYVERTTNNDNGGLVTLPFDVLLKQSCVEQPQADNWFKPMELDIWFIDL